MKEYRIQKIYDEDLFTDIYQIKDLKADQVLFTIGPKEGNLLEALKGKIQKEFPVYSRYMNDEIGVLKSNIGLSSSWTMNINGKTVAKAEIKGIQYFTIKITDGKQSFSGKTTDLKEIALKKGMEFSFCVKCMRENEDDRLNLLVKIDCKISPEALLTLAIAFDHKSQYEN